MILRPISEDKPEKHYLRLAREIRSDIEEGRLLPGQRMPTVKEMCSKSGLSAGTVRQALGLLKAQGLIELTPGRGTFVSVPKENGKSRKDMAIEAIDGLFQSLSSMGFSQMEARMLLSLRLAQMDQDRYVLPVALIAKYPEALRCAFYRLSEIPSIDPVSFTMEDVRISGEIALSEYPLVVCESSLINEVSAILSEKTDAVCPFVLAPAPQTILHLARLPEGARVCVYAQSDAFYKLVKKTVKQLSLPVSLVFIPAGTLTQASLDAFTHVITPSDVAAFADDSEMRLLTVFSQKVNTAVVFDLVVDEGSMLSISRRVSVLAERH